MSESDYVRRFKATGHCVTCGARVAGALEPLHHNWHNEMGQTLPAPTPAWNANLNAAIESLQTVPPERYGETILGFISEVAAAERCESPRLRERLLIVAARATLQYRQEEGLPSWTPEPYTADDHLVSPAWHTLARFAHNPLILARTAITLVARLDREAGA